MKIFLASSPSQRRILDLCKAPRRLLSYDVLKDVPKRSLAQVVGRSDQHGETREHDVRESTKPVKRTKTVVPVNGLKGKRKKKSKPKSSPKGFGLA